MAFRDLRRFKQAASQEECEALLSIAPRGVLSVHGENGYPYGIPVNFLYEAGRIFFHCACEGHKMDAVLADEKVCFTVVSEPVKNPGEWWNCFTSIVCFGRAKVVRDAGERDRILRLLGAKYFPEGYDLDADMIKNGPRAAVIEITLDHVCGKHVREK